MCWNGERAIYMSGCEGTLWDTEGGTVGVSAYVQLAFVCLSL